MKRKNTAAAPDYYPVVVVSDTHLGMDNASTDLLCEFLHSVKCDRLILNGDIIDGWRINNRRPKEFSEAQLRVFDAINRKIAEGTEVIYIPGNHDAELRRMGLSGKKIMGMRIEQDLELTDAKGRKLYVCHGDRFDPMQTQQAGFYKLPRLVLYAAGFGYLAAADRGYEIGAKLSSLFDKAAEKLIKKPLGLFSRVRRTLEGAFGSRGKMEGAAQSYAREHGYDGIICGHFHMSARKDDGGRLYLNSGDWIESFTALTMDEKGEWDVVKWQQRRKEKGLKRAFRAAAGENPDKVFRPMTEKLVAAVHRIWPGRGRKKHGIR